MSRKLSAPVVLESGDRLTRAEFHRRYCLRPDIRRAELIQGVVYVASPLRVRSHGQPHSLADLWLGTYAARDPALHVSIDSTLYLSNDDELQPDLMLFREPSPGGELRRTPDDYLEGVPPFVVEIAASSAGYDLHDKKESYRRAGVREYLVWRTIDAAIDWFRLQDNEYVRVEPDHDAIIESEVFPGLRLSVLALLTGDRATILAALG